MGKKGKKPKQSKAVKQNAIQEENKELTEKQIQKKKEIDEKIEKLKAKNPVVKLSGGVRYNRKINKIGDRSDTRRVDQFLKKFPYLNVNNKINRIGIFLMNHKQITITEPNKHVTNNFSKLRYLRDFNCFFLERYGQQITEAEFTEKPEAGAVRIPNRNEKKFKQEVVKRLGMTKEPEVASLIFDLEKEFWQLSQPELYSIGKSHYVIFGDLNVGQKVPPGQQEEQQLEKTTFQQDDGSIPEDLAAEFKKQMEEIKMLEESLSNPTKGLPNNIADPEEVEPEITPPDTGDLPEDDIQLIMNESNVSRGVAIKALKDADGDIVNAIMALT